jgi:hypothetical protein
MKNLSGGKKKENSQNILSIRDGGVVRSAVSGIGKPRI